MSGAAKQYAQRLLELGIMQHSSASERNGQGENLFMACGMPNPPSPDGAVDSW